MAPTTTAVTESTATASKPPFLLVATKALKPSPLNPRQHFDPTKLQELARTMGNGVGVIEPLVIRPNGASYEIVVGERRWRAAQIAELAEVPAVLKPLTDAQVLEIMVIENNQREDVHPLEEAVGYKRLLKFGFDVERLAERLGRSPKYVWDRMKLLDLVPEAKTLFLEGRFTVGHAILLARLKPEDQKRVIDPDDGGLFTEEEASWLFKKVERGGDKPGKYDELKPVSVRELDAYIAEHVRFDVTHFAAAAPLDFGATAARVEEAAAKPGRGKKVVAITHEFHIQEEARTDGERTFGPKAWKRADGQKKSARCASAVLGVVAVGPEYGQAFGVCIDKECDIHWKKERLERQRMQKLTSSGSAERQAKASEAAKRRDTEQREQRERARKAFEAARPKVLEAIAAAIKKAAPKAVADIVYAAAEGYHGRRKDAIARLGKPKTADDIVRVAALIAVTNEVREWNAFQDFPKVAKRFGVDVAKLVGGVQTSAHAEPRAKKSAKAKKR